ncbi:MAG: hypothetical protein AB1807_11355 [Pseudomonadota bacterium]
MYTEWGFRSCPFEPEALKADAIGHQLLVGRDMETRRVMTRLKASKKLVTLDGSNGVGKTSLVNIALYRCYLDYLKSPSNSLFIPCRTVFQLDHIDDLAAFQTYVLSEIALTFSERKQELDALQTGMPGAAVLNSILDQNLLGDWRLSISGSNSLNPDEVEQSGSNALATSQFESGLKEWLANTFFGKHNGAIVCVLDNLELLQTSKRARQCLESLRDTLFAVKGIRWVLCGANNIILSVASTPRLVGHLESPIDVTPLKKDCTEQIFSSRRQAYQVTEGNGYLPLTSAEFDLLYTVLNRNLRTTLSKCHDYCIWTYENGLHPKNDVEKKILFEKWLTKEALENEKACSSAVKQRAFEIFDRAAMDEELRDSFSLSQFQNFGFDSVNTLRPLVKELEDAGLLISQIDEDDNRRKTISVTPKGWLVNYSRILSGKSLPRK